jgi:aspartyl-tRNA(Asn)/glutamyl-tRNA(Gln) amidotransferase subunit A
MSEATASLGLVEMARLIRDGSLTSMQATDDVLARLEGPGKTLNAVMSVRAREARLAAFRADKTRAENKPLGPLHGVPLAHKDLFYREGEISTGGSKIRQDFVAPITASVLHRLDQAGAIDCGRLHLAEFALSPTGYNIHYGHGLNPRSIAHCSGGSSSGSAVAVAARIVPAALGTDTGGSIRHPAAMCGVFGLKPTWGLVPADGVMPLAQSLDCIGPITRTAADAALMLDVLIGREAHHQNACDGAVGGLSIAVVGGYYRSTTNEDVEAALVEAVHVLSYLGLVPRETTVSDMTFANTAVHLVMAVEGATLHRRWLDERPEDYAPQVRNRLEPGLFYPATRYVEALSLRADTARRWIEEAIGHADLALIPAIPGGVPTIAETTSGSPEEIAEKLSAITHCTRAINYLGLPAASVPCGFDRHGLPIAFQLVGRPHSEALILKVADAYQRATQFHD